MLIRALLILAVLALPACDFDIFDLPTYPTATRTPCLDAPEWELRGNFGSDVVEGQALLLSVGHSRELSAAPTLLWVEGCDEAVDSTRWVSTRPDVAGGFAPGTRKGQAWLTGLSPGETFVSAELTLTDGRAFTLPLIWHGTAYPVRVVPASASPATRRVLLEGELELEPEGSHSTPSTRAYLVLQVPVAGLLDMTVGWEAVSNRVIAHMCPGVVSVGCVPIIDGTRLSRRVPVSGSAHTTPGSHTLWITNHGPETARVWYQVGLIPD